jgi:NADH:ubiquinone oxidoreductase subunit 3 (subunit A)
MRYYPRTLLLMVYEMVMFLGILLIGILYGWREGAFKWQ